MYFAKRNGIKHRIAHSHSSDSSPGLRGNVVNTLSKTMKYMSNHYLGCSESAIDWLYGKNSKIKKEGNYRIIKNAIELEKYSIKKETRRTYKEKLGIQNNFIIGHIGR